MKTLSLLLVLLALFLSPSVSGATEVYARQTGKNCSFCHLDPAGGGELTAAGKEFSVTKRLPAAAGAPGAAAAPATASPQGAGPAAPSPALRVLHLVTGYLHLLTAFLWFGTILYVHLVLKPAYAAGGLPKGEVRVGLLSMVVMGVTGVILTKFRLGHPSMMFESRFGLLLLTKIILYLVMVVSAMVVVLVIGPRLKGKKQGGAPRPSGGELSAEELAFFDGKEGHPAYFALEGKVYEATASRLWKGGLHMGRHQAGQDLTEALKGAPHGPEKVLALPEVGTLVRQGSGKAPLHERVFFFMAYMNLTIVFLITFVIALWRWWG
ncbi:CopD family protein [Geomonas sp. Red32]|uniref:CopD family protein n=1 Tax=Geomonas sp. Red32 TaxID=2912856 RepID=UPI00202CA809|nr:CopD family protein [Geomonas sp. Red32]MCM0080404.1 CopD family protein [Geomonas sp. Red32]